MRVLVHDYSGHPFQVQLSRALAGRGHDVLHVHCGSYSTGKGAVEVRPHDPESLRIEAISMRGMANRYAPLRRVVTELRYGTAFTERAASFRPDVILSSNDPLFAKSRSAKWCKQHDVPWVFWLQDVYSFAMRDHVRQRVPVVGGALGSWFERLERRLLLEAASVVVITDDFVPLLQAWGIDDDACLVVENWAPLDELEVQPRDNPWSREHGLSHKRVALYAGTLGLKHDPSLLVALAEATAKDPDTAVVVVSDGLGATWLREQRDARGSTNLVLLPFQPWNRMPEVFATADVVLALLEPAAGIFSVPSKVLTYLCAGRPIVGAMPPENLAARLIERAGAGVVVPPGDAGAFVAAVSSLLDDEPRRQAAGAAARAYAERAFDIDTIADRFETLLAGAAGAVGRRLDEPVRDARD
jgi:glycosyltransferase involved in cell wall biosynthesis